MAHRSISSPDRAPARPVTPPPVASGITPRLTATIDPQRTEVTVQVRALGAHARTDFRRQHAFVLALAAKMELLTAELAEHTGKMPKWVLCIDTSDLRIRLEMCEGDNPLAAAEVARRALADHGIEALKTEHFARLQLAETREYLAGRHPTPAAQRRGIARVR